MAKAQMTEVQKKANRAFKKVADAEKALRDAKIALMTRIFDDAATQIDDIINKNLQGPESIHGGYLSGMRWCVERAEGETVMRVSLHQMVEGGMAPLIRSDTGKHVAIEVAYRPDKDHENITLTCLDSGFTMRPVLMAWFKPETYESNLYYNISGDVKSYCELAYGGYFPRISSPIPLTQGPVMMGVADPAPPSKLRAA